MDSPRTYSLRSRREAGFSFIEILVVMSIIVVLVSMVVVVVPMMTEKARRTKSSDNVRSLLLMYTAADIGVSKPYPKLNGKNFTLWVVGSGELAYKKNKDNLGILFSPGDQHLTFDSVTQKDYEPVTMAALRSEGHDDFRRLTSYAGRRNNERQHELTPAELAEGALILCDDDEGAPHHAKGMILGFTNGSAKFMSWGDLEIQAPDEKDATGLLGDNAGNEMLKHMSSGN
jgi:prepilin-type N-terminal cleavage/methylation domain-containing protein